MFIVQFDITSDGRKLREKHITAVDGLTVQMGNTLELTPAQTMAVDSMDYAGNLRFRRQRISSSHVFFNLDYHFDGGYLSVTPPASTSQTSYNTTSHFFICDYQGNNRLVVDGSDNIKQINHYYPYGGPWYYFSTDQGFQPFKYNGKEFDRVHGLDWYDYGARRYDPSYSLFTQMDPLAEQYPHLSPYAYCAGNPVRYVDPDGRKIVLKSLSDEESKDYLDHIAILRANSSLFDIVYRTLEDSKDIYNVRYSVFQSSQGTEGKGRFVANKNGGGDIEFGKNRINDLDKATYLEEVFHAYQYENRLGYDKGDFNREFEAKTFVAIASNEAGIGYPVLESMVDFQMSLQDYSYKGLYGVPSPLIATSFSFFNQYFHYANTFSIYNSTNGIRNKNYLKRTTVLPYSLLKVISQNF